MPKTLYCDENLLKTDLSGRTAIVTGANSGIGEATAHQLAKQGAHVILACRKEAQAQETMERIRTDFTDAKVEFLPLDLGSLASVRKFAQAFRERHESLHLLINNAGVMNTPQGRTLDGFETQIGVNHLGHFLLTELLLPTLRASAPARIVNVSSCYHDRAMGRDGDIHFDDLFFEHKKYDGWTAYAQSKLANLLHAKELSRRLEGTGVVAVSVHPGWVRSGLMRHSMPGWVEGIARPIMSMMGQIEPSAGAQASLHAALSPDVPNQPGAFYSQVGFYRDSSLNPGGFPLRSPNPSAHDEEKARRLYEVSGELVGLKESAAVAA